MNVLVTGADGQLGITLVDRAPDRILITATTRSDLDITNRDQVMSFVHGTKPSVVINTAAFTNVDLAETEPEAANAVNVDGARNVAEAADNAGARLIHLSTDFVFDGLSTTPYKPGDAAEPPSRYGQSKLGGEKAVYGVLGDNAVILRTSWLYSRFSGNFVTTMLRLMRSRDELSVVSDQVGSPTWTAPLADMIYRFLERPELGGYWHWSDAGITSWYDYAIAIQEEALALGMLEHPISIAPCTSEEYGAPAPRPAFSALDISATEQEFDTRAINWRDNLRTMLTTGVDS